MIDKERIEQWVKEGTISKEQAQKMLVDISRDKKERSSNKLIIAISTIGAILVGIGIILFIASNWRTIPDIVKLLILLGSTLGIYYLGYIFKYQKQNLPKVGASLIFLSALLFGANVFLIGQKYHVNANNPTLILIWLAGIVPLVYILKTKSMAGLFFILSFIWIGLYMFKKADDLFYFPVLYLVSGILFFGIGGLHYLSDGLKDIARIYRIGGIQIAMLSLFLLTLRAFSGHYGDLHSLRKELEISSQFPIELFILSAIAIIFAIINLIYNPPKSDISILEGIISLGLIITALIFFFFPSSTNIYVILFNLILAGIILVLLFVGYNREDMELVNIGMGYLSILIIVRYFDFFWKLLPRSIFFTAGGLILILGGISLERKRRQLKERFGG